MCAETMEVFMRTLALGIGLFSFVGVAFLGSACSNSVVVGKGGAGGMTGATTGTSPNTVATGTTGTNGTGGMTSATNGTGSVGTTTGSANTGSTGTGVSCTPGPGDNACSTCVKTKCCNAIMSCDADPTCATCASCIEANGNNLQACQGMCSFQDMPTQQVVGCAYQMCQASCGGTMTTTTTTGTGMTTSTSTGGMTCPPAAGDTACVSCAKMNCCAQYDACVADPTCTCFAACLAGPAPNNTFQYCSQPPNAQHPNTCGMIDLTTGQLGQCVQTHNCGCPTGIMGG